MVGGKVACGEAHKGIDGIGTGNHHFALFALWDGVPAFGVYNFDHDVRGNVPALLRLTFIADGAHVGSAIALEGSDALLGKPGT